MLIKMYEMYFSFITSARHEGQHRESAAAGHDRHEHHYFVSDFCGFFAESFAMAICSAKDEGGSIRWTANQLYEMLLNRN